MAVSESSTSITFTTSTFDDDPHIESDAITLTATAISRSIFIDVEMTTGTPVAGDIVVAKWLRVLDASSANYATWENAPIVGQADLNAENPAHIAFDVPEVGRLGKVALVCEGATPNTDVVTVTNAVMREKLVT